MESARRARYISSHQDSRGIPALTVWEFEPGDRFCLSYSDGTTFWIDQREAQICATWPETLTLEDTATYLVGPVMGFVLRLRGITCLHASAIVVGGRAIALMGPPTAGKSTSATAFAERGYAVLTDDVVPLVETGGEFSVQPGYPRLCLWPEAARALYGSPDHLPAITPNWDKRYVDLSDGRNRFAADPVPLAAIYLLGERSANPEAPRVSAVPRAAAIVHLLANTYMNYLLDQELRAREFEFLGRLVAHVPVRSVRPHEDAARLGELCNAILADFHSHAAPRSASAAAR